MKQISVLGVPFSVGCREQTSQAISQHKGPAALRRELEKLCSGFNIPHKFKDLGDIEADGSTESVLASVCSKVKEIRSSGSIPFLLGGAHTLSLGTLRALAETEEELSLLYIDSHPDIMPRETVDYGSTMFHAIEEGLVQPENISFIGLRQVEQEEWNLIEKRKIQYFTPAHVCQLGVREIVRRIQTTVKGSLLISIDLDSIDPSFAPGVTTPYPLGLSPREVLSFATAFCEQANVAGVEIVELSPACDIKERTAELGAALWLEISRVLAG